MRVLLVVVGLKLLTFAIEVAFQGLVFVAAALGLLAVLGLLVAYLLFVPLWVVERFGLGLGWFGVLNVVVFGSFAAAGVRVVAWWRRLVGFDAWGEG